MSLSLDAIARQCRFVIREGPTTRKLSLPIGWTSVVAISEEDWILSVQRSLSEGHRVVGILSAEQFDSGVKQLRSHVSADAALRLGVFVIAPDPSAFLDTHRENPELLDVTSEKEVRKNGAHGFYRALRQLHKLEERGDPQFGQKALATLNEIFIELSAERNPERLLATILLKAMDLTSAGGGSLFMVEESDGEMNFRIRISDERSDQITFQHATSRAVENSICGYVALTGKMLNIPDVSLLRPLTLPQFNKSFDHVHKDKTVSLLTLPLKNSRNEIIAILQLVNKTARGGVGYSAFESSDESLLISFATQAAICIENVDLYGDIQRLFEGFVKASISAIESRDPSTGGHSERVAKMSVALARATTECEVGIYRSVKFREEEIRELEYAALLHDFGKIGVREEVLVKAKKLYPYQLEGIRDRIKICKAAAKIAYLEKRLKHGESESTVEKEYQQRLREIDNHWQIILAANEPNIQKKESMRTLERIRSEHLLLPDGSRIAVLSDEEYRALAVTQGSLTDTERLEIESHVRHTYQFLKMIPWTKDFRHLTEIAYCHHEKLDGTGYPRGLSSHEIPLQSKIMTIADIFDALTAADRWYKEAVPTQRALDILRHEVAQGKLDPVLFEIFVEKRIFELSQPRLATEVA